MDDFFLKLMNTAMAEKALKGARTVILRTKDGSTPDYLAQATMTSEAAGSTTVETWTVTLEDGSTRLFQVYGDRHIQWSSRSGCFHYALDNDGRQVCDPK